MDAFGGSCRLFFTYSIHNALRPIINEDIFLIFLDSSFLRKQLYTIKEAYFPFTWLPRHYQGYFMLFCKGNICQWRLMPVMFYVVVTVCQKDVFCIIRNTCVDAIGSLLCIKWKVLLILLLWLDIYLCAIKRLLYET